MSALGRCCLKSQPLLRTLVSDRVFTGLLAVLLPKLFRTWVICPGRRRLHERYEPFQVLNNCSQVELIACA